MEAKRFRTWRVEETQSERRLGISATSFCEDLIFDLNFERGKRSNSKLKCVLSDFGFLKD